ncbi:MAG TPA: hypothetical protein VM140_04930 [Burkholderiales bacterium]|nr:hypothetical protein [Burkholderiales bacterium]
MATFREAAQRGAFSEIYGAASPDLRNAVSEESFLRVLQAVSRRLGGHVGSELKQYRIDPKPPLALVTLAYVTQFQRGPAAEKFVFVVAEGRAALGSYDIQSPMFEGAQDVQR